MPIDSDKIKILDKMTAACGSCGFFRRHLRSTRPTCLKLTAGERCVLRLEEISFLTFFFRTMLGSLHRLLIKLCDPRNSLADSSPRPPKVAVVEKLPTWTRVVKRRPQMDGLPIERHDTQSNHFHNVKSIINQLPNELLAEIFTTV